MRVVFLDGFHRPCHLVKHNVSYTYWGLQMYTTNGLCKNIAPFIACQILMTNAEHINKFTTNLFNDLFGNLIDRIKFMS